MAPLQWRLGFGAASAERIFGGMQVEGRGFVIRRFSCGVSVEDVGI